MNNMLSEDCCYFTDIFKFYRVSKKSVISGVWCKIVIVVCNSQKWYIFFLEFLFGSPMAPNKCAKSSEELKCVYCGRRCLAALNKFHKIQQNEIEQIRGTVLINIYTCDLEINYFLNPLVISYKKYIYWKLFMRFH